MSGLIRIKSISILIIILLVFSPIASSSLLKIEKQKKGNIFENKITDEKIFDFKIKTLMKIGQCPSLSACIITNDSMIWSKSYGFSDIYNRKRATTDTVYITSSVTKPITATAILQLYERDLIDLDEDINNYMPFSLRNPYYPNVSITFRMLLSHRASIYDHCIFKITGLPYLYKSFPNYNELGEWIKQTLTPNGKNYKSDYWYDLKPGEKPHYSNLGYLILGYLIGTITNLKFQSYVEENILKPLDMNNSSFYIDKIDQSKAAVSYIHRFGLYIPLPKYHHCGFASVAGLKTTVNDLSHFLIAQLNKGVYNGKRILKKSSVDLMQDTIYPSSIEDSPLPDILKKHSDRTYGLGLFSCNWFDGRETIGHFGMSAGAAAYMMINKSTNTGFIAFSNQFDLLGFFELKLYIKMEVFYKIGSLLFEKSEKI